MVWLKKTLDAERNQEWTRKPHTHSLSGDQKAAMRALGCETRDLPGPSAIPAAVHQGSRGVGCTREAWVLHTTCRTSTEAKERQLC